MVAYYAAGAKLPASNLAGIKDTGATFTVTITGGGAFAVGNGVKAGEQQRVGARNFVRIIYTFGSTSNQGTGGWTFSGFDASVAGPSVAGSTVVGHWYYARPASTTRAYGPIMMAAGTSTVQGSINTGALAAFTAVGAAQPEAWASGAIIVLEFNYPII